MRFRLLAGVPEAEAQRLLAVARRRAFARGEVVFHRDDPADCLHLIAKGRFAVRVITPLGDTATVAVRGVGDNFGETALVAFLAAELRRQNDLLLEALYLPVDRRLRRRLLELARIYGGERGEVEIPLTQAELASMAGTSRATANQILRAEQEAGTLELGRGHLLVRDRAALARRAR